MSKRKSEEQIIALLKRAEAGEPIADWTAPSISESGLLESGNFVWLSKTIIVSSLKLKRRPITNRTMNASFVKSEKR